MPREKLGEILIRAGLLDEKGLRRALNEQARWGGQLGRYLVDLGLISEETLVRALSTQYKLPAVALDPPKLELPVAQLIPREICERHGLICFRADTKTKFLDVAIGDPTQMDAIDAVRVATKYNVRPYVASPKMIDQAIQFAFYGTVDFGEHLDLSPESSMRIDNRGSVFHAEHSSEINVPEEKPARRKQASQASVPIKSPGREDHRDLKAQMEPFFGRLGSDSVDELEEAAKKIAIPSSVNQTAESFHITLDVPPVDKEQLKKSAPAIEDRLATLEIMNERNTLILQELLRELVRKRLISIESVQKILLNR